ncbi:hypothetical protein ORI99_11145, partial [Alishewanella sp. SMS9]|nr:hypothetical protein [Alishewanella sp. SMS9]
RFRLWAPLQLKRQPRAGVLLFIALGVIFDYSAHPAPRPAGQQSCSTSFPTMWSASGHHYSESLSYNRLFLFQLKASSSITRRVLRLAHALTLAFCF